MYGFASQEELHGNQRREILNASFGNFQPISILDLAPKVCRAPAIIYVNPSGSDDIIDAKFTDTKRRLQMQQITIIRQHLNDLDSLSNDLLTTIVQVIGLDLLRIKY